MPLSSLKVDLNLSVFRLARLFVVQHSPITQ